MGHLRTHCVTPMVSVVLPAVSVSEPASERVKRARLQLSSQDVPLVHGQAAANHRQEQEHKVEHSCIAQFHLDKTVLLLYLRLCNILNTAQNLWNQRPDK